MTVCGTEELSGLVLKRGILRVEFGGVHASGKRRVVFESAARNRRITQTERRLILRGICAVLRSPCEKRDSLLRRAVEQICIPDNRAKLVIFRGFFERRLRQHDGARISFFVVSALYGAQFFGRESGRRFVRRRIGGARRRQRIAQFGGSRRNAAVRVRAGLQNSAVMLPIGFLGKKRSRRNAPKHSDGCPKRQCAPGAAKICEFCHITFKTYITELCATP